jgi:hypothetical protein
MNVVLYDRKMKRQLTGADPILPTAEMLMEHRGPMTASTIPGWDGY